MTEKTDARFLPPDQTEGQSKFVKAFAEFLTAAVAAYDACLEVRPPASF